MIGAVKAFAKRHWPALRLRTILFSVLVLVAALPVASAVFLRVYENTLVRQTEAELAAQGAALAAAAEVVWPGRSESPPPAAPPLPARGDYHAEPVGIDLSSTPVLPERPPATPRDPAQPPDPEAERAAQALAPVLRETSRTTLASIVLLDRAGRELVGPEAGGGHAVLPEVRAALAGEPRTVLRRNAAYHPRYSFEWLSRASALRIHHARPIARDGRVLGALLLSRSPRALFKGVYQDRAKIGLGFVGICAVLVVLSGLVSRGITRPIETLGAATRRLAAGQGGAPETPQTAVVEIRALFDDVRVMAEAIERRSRYLRDFAAAVSHEFKTPLAGIRGATELLQDHAEAMSEGEQRRFLDNIAADTERLSQLVARLLDLARADMARPEAGAAVELAAPLRRAADAQGDRGLRVELRLPGDLPRVSVPAGAIETVLTALLENSRQAGATRVDITARVQGDALLLSVADDGPGVAVADRDRLFEPFFTSRRDCGGTGLGLSIARSLLAASHATIILQPSQRGTLFEVSLPVARPA